MSRIKIEPYEANKHRDFMWGVGEAAAKRQRHQKATTLEPYNVCVVDVCSFTFVFHDLGQLEACLDYYRREHQPSSRLPVYTENLGGDHWECQRWFEMLPQHLLEKSKRVKVVAALEKARELYWKAGG